MADDAADCGSMIDSVIFVIVRSRFTGKKFLTPEIRLSMLTETPESLSDEVRREEIEEKPRNISPDVLGCAGCEGAEVIMVMRVVARTLLRIRIAYRPNKILLTA